MIFLPLLLAACDTSPYPDYFTDTDGAPEITAVTPATSLSPAAGVAITLTGSNLGTTRTVVVGGRNATLVSVSDTSVAVTLPDAAPGSGAVDVAVATDFGVTWAEDAFAWTTDGWDWWANEVASVALYSVDCPAEAWGHDPTTDEWFEAWWCGMSMGYADGYGFWGAGRQPGFAGDLAGFAEVSSLPMVGETRVFGPGDRRPPVAPMLYGNHPEDESLGITTPRDFARDLQYLEDRDQMLLRYYYWFKDIQEHLGPLARLFDEDGRCIHANGDECVTPMSGGDTGCIDLDVVSGEGDELVVDGDAIGAAGVDLGLGKGEVYAGDPTVYYSFAFNSSASVDVSADGGTLTGGPSGAVLDYDNWSGWYWKKGSPPLVRNGDLPPDADYEVSWNSLGQTQTLGTVRGVSAITGLKPGVLAGDATFNRNRELTLTWDPVVPDESGDPSYLVVDLRIYDANVVDPNWMTEVYRVVARGDDAAGTVTIPPAVMAQLPDVYNAQDANWDLVGYWAELTVARHQFRKVPIEGGDLVVDFMHVVSAPVMLTDYAD